ncbi:hypothetical protein BCU68_14450 [Vibrio sp. 10N.286.49.B3]|uniref:hypothetical protein n=1 Tax=Vibrio sp. 10N.286.49.B3 TaxID=1880855 RepID=UPI000C836072|nr:hypothetical protein [Vibrio sp. 10N.286.49.B3]PMH42206.1 hypothetical protein BCU68_14450 [Vibrio sp. 10N.286.49.B3]
MYKYVSNKMDLTYKSPIPNGDNLTLNDIPEEELEIREVVSCWYEKGFQHLDRLESSDIDINKKSIEKHQQVISRYDSTLLFLLKNKAYHASLSRILTQWDRDSAAFAHIKGLLYISEAQGEQH